MSVCKQKSKAAMIYFEETKQKENFWGSVGAFKCNLLEGSRTWIKRKWKVFLWFGGTEGKNNVKEIWKACNKKFSKTLGREGKALNEQNQVEGRWSLSVTKFKRRKSTRRARNSYYRKWIMNSPSLPDSPENIPTGRPHTAVAWGVETQWGWAPPPESSV